MNRITTATYVIKKLFIRLYYVTRVMNEYIVSVQISQCWNLQNWVIRILNGCAKNA